MPCFPKKRKLNMGVIYLGKTHYVVSYQIWTNCVVVVEANSKDEASSECIRKYDNGKDGMIIRKIERKT